ncbi:MAG: carboxymuconolactone decarboxylase family protein [Chloroflexales bacterium]
MAIKHLRAAPSAAAIRPPLAAQIRRDFGTLVDPFLLHAPAPAILAGVWMACRESELVGRVPRATKEAVAATVSRINQCPYCVDAHAVMLHAVDSHSAADHIRTGRSAQPLSSDLRDVVAWASATRSPEAPILRDPPFTASAAPEIIGTAVFYHYINRMVSVLLDLSPLPLVPAPLTGMTARVAGWWFSQAARRAKAVGESLEFLPTADLPPDMAWAAASPIIAGAFARFAAAVDAAGGRALDAPVRALARREIDAWSGAQPGLGRAWLETPLLDLPPAQRPTGRLVLLTALAPYQVDAATVTAFQEGHPGDADLIAALAWASLTAARRVGAWL